MRNTKAQFLIIPTLLALLLIFIELIAPYAYIKILQTSERNELITASHSSTQLDLQPHIIELLNTPASLPAGEFPLSDLISKSTEDPSYQPLLESALANLSQTTPYLVMITYPDGTHVKTPSESALPYLKPPLATFTHITHTGKKTEITLYT